MMCVFKRRTDALRTKVLVAAIIPAVTPRSPSPPAPLIVAAAAAAILLCSTTTKFFNFTIYCPLSPSPPTVAGLLL